jgi:hypothetical protein
MMMKRWIELVVLLLLPVSVIAQGEVLSPLTMRLVPEALREKSALNTHFIYQYQSQDIPLMDDFSIDRTRKRWAQPGDPGVTLDQVIQHLVVAGVSTPDMAFSLDTTFRYTTDVGDETITTTRAALPEIAVLVNNLSIYPVTGSTVTAWPAYNIFDTIQSPLTEDTLYLPGPDLRQDSLMVYTVAPAGGVYMMGNQSTPLILWEDDDVYVNDTYPVEPPSIGVATFDGVSRTGIPYDFMNYSSYGIADRLTSVPINLLRPASDSIYLSFFFQPRGLSGDIHGQAGDSLVLEFYAPQEDYWYRVWRSPYTALTPGTQPPFQQVMIPIKQFRYLQNGFRMRFFNYASLSGSFDHWHLDYVRLGAQRSHDDTVLVDVAYVYPESSILETYTSVPYARFAQSPSTLMATSVTLPQRNLDVNDRFITYGYRAGIEGGTMQQFNTGTNIANNASSIFNSVHPISYVHETPGGAEEAFYKVEFFTNATPDINRYNDTTSFIQELSNYYAYDDGSAEAGYGLNTAGARLAYRFDLLGPDSLRALRMYFNPMANLPPTAHPSTGSFLVTVWSDLASNQIIHQNFSFSSPEYRQDGLNKFVEFPLDSVIPVSGTIYVGWTQTNNVPMNIGFDRNRNNQNKIFYNVGGTWQNTSFTGSLMMRPVMVSGTDPFVGVEEERGSEGLGIFPNPAGEGFQLRTEHSGNAMLECLDATGRIVSRTAYRPGMFISTAGLPDGLYLVRLTDMGGALIAHGRVVVQH